MQQTIDAAQIDEGTVVGDVFDHTFDNQPFLQALQQLVALFAGGLFEHGAARDDDVVALAVELDDLEFKFLVFVGRGVLDRTHVDERAGQEGADAVDHDGQAALDATGNVAGNNAGFVERFFQIVPGRDALGLVARQDGVAIAVFQTFDGDFNVVIDGDFKFAPVVAEFVNGNVAFGFQRGIDDDEIVLDVDDLSGDDFTSAQLPGFAFSEKVSETFVCGSGLGGHGKGWILGVPTGKSISGAPLGLGGKKK